MRLCRAFLPILLAALLPAALLMALMLLAPAAGAQQDSGITALVARIANQERLLAELRTAVPRQGDQAQAEAERLDRDERGLDAGAITMAMLRQARFDADARRIRINATEDQAAFYALEAERLESRTAELTRQAGGPPDTLEAYAAGVELRLDERLRGLVQETLDLYRGMTAGLRRGLDLYAERVALLQSRIRLGTLPDEGAQLESDPRVVALRRLAAEAGRDSIRLANAAAGIEPQAAGEAARKRRLELAADLAFLRGTMYATDIDLTGIGLRLASLRALAAEPSLPPHLAGEGSAALDGLRERLAGHTEALATVRRRLDEQRTLLPPTTPATAAAIATMRGSIDDVGTIADGQERAIKGLGTSVQDLGERFASLTALAENAALQERQPLPTGGEAWLRVGASAAEAPGQLAAELGKAGREIRGQVAQAPPRRLLLAGAAVLSLVLGAFLVRRFLHRRIVLPQPEGVLAAPAAAVRESIPSLLPAALWWAVTAILEVGREATLLVGGVLAIWPVVAFLLRLARRLLFRDAREGLETRLRFYGRLRWTMLLGGVLAGLVILTRTLPLSPLLADLVDRSAMLCVLLIALPALQLPSLVLALFGTSKRAAGVSARLVASASAIVPAVLAIAAAMGLLGWLNLAWAIIVHFLWLVLVGSVLVLVMGLLRDTARGVRRRIMLEHPHDGDFWIVNFVDPAYRLVQLLLVLLAGWGILRIYGWGAETPVIREAIDASRTPILTLGDSSLSAGNLVTAVILVALAFWVGGWSRQISYHLALTKVRDPGIRQSLSTFVQYVVLVLGLLLTLRVVGLDLTALTVFAASIGVGIGFGLQNITNNFISGIMLLAERPLRIGDTVTIGSDTGEVNRIGIRSLTVRTFERKEVIIPNSAVIGASFTNWTRTDDMLREVLMFRVSYHDDARKAAARVQEAAAATQGVLRTPPPKATVYEFTDLGVSIRLQYVIDLRGVVGGLDIREAILGRVYAAFAEDGYRIPLPSGEIRLADTAREAPLLPVPAPA